MSEPVAADARFEACLRRVLAHEGGYVDNPSDPGGATNLGITRKTLAAWRKVSPWTSLSKAEVAALTRNEAAQIYRALYWRPVAGDALPAGLDLALFDYAVNSGPARAIKALQVLLHVHADGQFGPITMGATQTRIAAGDLGRLIGALCDGRLSFLQRLATFSVFGRGWSRRVAEVRAAALTMAGLTQPPTQSTSRRNPMDVLSGYRTYVVAGLMLLAGLAELAGVPVPAMDGQSAGHLLMEAFAIIFLRKGIANAGRV